MLTIGQQLLALEAIRIDIKDSIEDQGITVGSTPFSGYSALIDSITCVQTGSTAIAPIVREYTSSDTWNKPSGITGIFVVAIGAGGSGGSGARSNGGTAAGGSGGSGGAMALRYISSATLTASTETVTIGAGGASASGRGINANGFNGSNGGDSSFGTLVVAKGGLTGLAGAGATVAGVGGGPTATCVPNYFPQAFVGGASGQGTRIASTSKDSPNGFTAGIACAGGAGGGGVTSSVFNSGGTAGGTIVEGVTTAGGSAGVTDGQAGTAGVNDVQTKILKMVLDHTTTAGVGTAGGGGAGGTVNGGVGGNGGRCCGGGGGGGAASGTSGASGVGGAGLVYVIEYYS